MRITRLSLCLAGVLCLAALAFVPLSADERPKVDEELLVMVYAVADLPVWMHDSDEYNPSLLINYLRLKVGEDQWDQGAIGRHDKTAALIIRQTRANHRIIADTLSLYRQSKNENEQNLLEEDAVSKVPSFSLGITR